MKKRIVLYIIALVVIIGAAIGIAFLFAHLLSKYATLDYYVSLWVSLSIELMLALPLWLLRFFKYLLKRIAESREYEYKLEYRNKPIRLSFSYLIRIRVNRFYLLVKGGHGRELYGPVGGVYHINHTDYVYKTLGFSKDWTPGDSEDVRGIIKGKRIRKFIRWFNSGVDRETSPNREFSEELIESGVVPKDLFTKPAFKFIGTKYLGIAYDPYYKIDGLRRFDVFELVLTKEQENWFMANHENESIRLATRDEIETGGITSHNDRRNIGDQTLYILEDRFI